MKSKKRTSVQSDTNDTGNSEENQDVPKSTNNKKTRLFSAKEFRTKLKTTERKEALVDFLKLCSQEHGERAIKEYLDKGGSGLELLQILDNDPGGDHCVILNLVNHILLRIISNYPSLHNQTLEACQFFLSTKFPLINKMLSFASVTEERRTILKLLATFVTFSSSLSREILQNINFNPGNLELLTKQTGEKDSVRSAFIKFVVAFLLEGHFPTISLLLEKKGVLSVVINGLVYDEADVVCIILSALKEYVLENPMVSKTVKMKLFNTQVVAEIINLYNWKGPANFNLYANKKRREKVNTTIEINEYDKSKVNETVHGFLLILCTSHRYGVIFSDHTVGLGKTGSNNLVFSVLDKLEKAWEHSYASDLILKICKACPDLVKTVWNKLKDTLEPRDSENWRKAIKFAISLLHELSPDCIEYCFEELSLTQRIQVTEVLVAPLAVLKVIIPENQESISKPTRYHVYLFLSKSLHAIKSYRDYFQKYFIEKDFLIFKNSLNNYIYRNFPDVSYFLKDLSMPIVELSKIENLELLEVLFDIFEFYEKLCPQHSEALLQITDPNFNFNLDDLYERLESINKEENSARDLIQTLEIKLIKTFLNIDETLFNTSNRFFDAIFSSLITHYRNTKDKDIYEMLEKMFLLIDILKDNRDEIKVWIDSIFYGDSFENCVGKILAQSLKDIGENTENYLFKENLSSNEHDDDDDDDELYHKNDILSILDALKAGTEVTTLIHLSHKTLSPLLQSVLNCLSRITDKHELDSLKNYLNYTLINLLHLQTTPSTLIAIVLQEKYNKVVPKIVSKYLSSWKAKSDIQIPEKVKGTLKILQNFWSTEENFKEFLKLDLVPSLNFFLLNMCVFYVSNFGKLHIFDPNYVNRTLELIKLFLQDEYCGKGFLKTVMEAIFYNPLFLQQFLPSKTMKIEPNQVCTNFIYEIVKIFQDAIINVEYLNKEDLESFLKPYRRKVLVCLEKSLKKPKKLNSEKYENLLETIKIFGLSEEDCKIVLKKCLEVDEIFLISEDSQQLSLLYHLVGHSLECFLETSVKKTSLQPLEGDIIKVLSQKLTFLNINENNLKTSELADALKKYLQQFPHSFQFISESLFESLLKKDQYCAENSQLAVAILKHKRDYLSLLETNMHSLSAKKGLLLPLLEVAIELSCDDILLKRIFEEIEPVILKCLEKPQKANQHVEKHIDSINTLIKRFMSLEFCETYFNKVKKFNISEKFLFKIVSVLFTKAIDESKTLTTINVSNYIMTSIYLLNTFIKNKIPEDDAWKKLEDMISIFNINLIKLKEKEFDLKDISENESLKQYCKFCLKYGIANKNFLLNNLNTFIVLGIFDENNASIIFDMATAHSEFLNSLLGNEEEAKAELLFLIFSCCKNWPQLIQKNHLPVILSAYHATCRRSDRIIFHLLKLYETHFDKSDFYTYKPFLFGSAAASHYSVRQNIQNALWRQPKVRDVIDLLEEKLVNDSIDFFPVDIDLNQTIENISGQIQNPDVYNLAFLLPLFSSLLAPENVVPTYKFTKSGAISLTVLALSSKIKETRLAACCVLCRFYTHLEAKPENRDKVLWLRYVEAFCKGAAAFENVKLNSFSAIFWAKMALILTMPMHPLYLSSSSYLTAKLSPDLSGVPELYTWLHDSSVGFEEHQIFVLKLLKDGMKTKGDFQVALKSMAFKLIMELCNSCVSTKNVRLYVVKVLESASKINFGAQILVESHGVLSWLLHFTQKLSLDDYGVLESVVNILVNIMDYKRVDLFVVNSILTFVIDAGLISCLRTKCLVQFLDLLCKCTFKGCTLGKKQLNVLIDYVNDKFCNYLLFYGKKFVILEDYSSSDQTVFLLRKLVLLCIDNTN